MQAGAELPWVAGETVTGEWVVEVWEEEEGKAELSLGHFQGFAEELAEEYGRQLTRNRGHFRFSMGCLSVHRLRAACYR